jgi:hypothetical protein
MNATIERPADLTIETEITRALRAQRADLPTETTRLEARLGQLKAQRDSLAQAVVEARVKVRAGVWKQPQLDRALADLEQLDHEIRSTEITFDELATTQRVIVMELAEQLARRRATVAPQITAQARRAITAISEGLAALQPHVDALRALDPAVAQFERAVSVHGHTVYHRDLPESVVRAVNFFTKDYRGGCELAALRERWQAIADAVK